MATYEQLMDAARRADSAGDLRGARRFLELAKEQGQSEAGGQMADMTLEQQRAIALARARLRRQQQDGGPWEKYQNPEAGPWERYQAQQTPEKGMGQVIWENLVGDDDPTTQNLGEKVGSFLNKGGESMTMGLIGDEASAAAESLLPGVDYADRRDHYRQQEAQFEESNPGMALAADVGGAMAAPLGALGAVGKGAGWIKRAAASGGATGLLSGIYGAMEGEGGFDSRMADAKADAALGGGIGLAIPLLGAGVQRVANSRATRKAIKEAVETAPSTEELRKAGQAAYRAVDDAGVAIKPEAARGLFDNLTEGMRASGLDEGASALNLTPGAKRLSEVMQEAVPGDEAVPFGLLDQIRRKAGVPASNLGNKLDQRLGTQAIEGLDDFINNLPADGVAAGNADDLPQLVNTARDIWSKMSRSQLIDDAIEASENYVSGPASGLRNQFARILRNKKLSRGFSEAEKKMMKRVVDGSLPERLIHLAGGGLGQLFAIGGGVGTGGLLGGVLGTGAAAGARKMSERIASKNAEALRAVVANGGLLELPLASTQAAGLLEQLARQGTAAGVQR